MVLKWSMILLLLVAQSISAFGWACLAPTEEIPVNVYVNGQEVDTDAAAFLENGITYVPLRPVSEALCVQAVAWDGTNQMAVIRGETEVRVTVGSSIARVNGQSQSVNGIVKLLQDRVFVPLRFLAEALDAKVAWDQQYYMVELTKPGIQVPDANRTYSYTRDELFWLARIIAAESAGEPMQGRIAVGNVVLNRVASPLYPNTIYGVIFDRRHGVQFQPVANGTVYNTPGPGCVIAAKRALNGENYAGPSLYFLNVKTATSFWITETRAYYTTIQNHRFYL